MTEKKNKAHGEGQANHNHAPVASPEIKDRPAEDARANRHSFNAGGDCQDALMRCYNR